MTVDDEIRRGIERAQQAVEEFAEYRRREQAEELAQRRRSAEIGEALRRFLELMHSHGDPGTESMRMEAERERTTSLRGWAISEVAVGPEASSVFLLLTTNGRLFRSFGRPFECGARPGIRPRGS